MLLQDKRDDVVAGVKSTALLFADRTRPILGAFAASQLALLGVTGASCVRPPASSVTCVSLPSLPCWQLQDADGACFEQQASLLHSQLHVIS